MSRFVSGTECNLPRECYITDCTQLTQVIIVCGCIEQHVEDQYYCQEHADIIINAISHGNVCCHQNHEIISYQMRDIHWEVTAFPLGGWVLTGPAAHRVIAVSYEPQELMEKMSKLPYSTQMYRIDNDGPRAVYLRTSTDLPLNLTCGCGKEATWYLVYGCEENKHVWDIYMCRHCLYLTVGFPNSYTIRDRVYTASVPWTCMNIKVSPDMQKHIPKENWELQCEVTSWYARELTPDMIERIKQTRLAGFRERSNVQH